MFITSNPAPKKASRVGSKFRPNLFFRIFICLPMRDETFVINWIITDSSVQFFYKRYFKELNRHTRKIIDSKCHKEISSKSYAQFIFNILIKTFRLNRMLKPMFHIIIPKIVFIGLGPKNTRPFYFKQPLPKFIYCQFLFKFPNQIVNSLEE